MIEIKHRHTDVVLFSSSTARDRRGAVVEAAKAGANLFGANLEGTTLKGANLEGADLRGANLEGADLRGANIGGANLEGANLEGANLEGTDLRGANLEGADLRGANIGGANLEGANLEGTTLKGANLGGANLEGTTLKGANLEGADLEGADLKGADLESANLAPIRDDVRAVLDTAPNEVHGLLLALREGRIDGSTYRAECACLVGTIANVRGVDVGTLPQDIARPAERWFLAITPGMTPSTSQVSAITESWIVEWMEDRK